MQYLTAEKMWSIPRVGAPVAVGDHTLIVPVTEYDPDTDDPTTTLYRVDPGAGELRRYASGRLSSVAASHDGSRIAFLKKVGSHDHVHVQRLDGGEPEMVTELPLGAVGVRWMPDGRLIALATLWADHPDLDATRAHEKDERVTARATENVVYRYWDSWLDHVYHPVVIDPDSGDVVDLTPGSTRFWRWPNSFQPIDDIDVSPDGSLIALCMDDSEPPHRDVSWSIFLVRPDGTEPRRIDAGRVGNSHRPRFTPDGKALVYGYQEEPDYYASPMLLFRHDLETGEERQLLAGWDRSPEGWTFAADGSLLFVAEDRARCRLWRLPEGADGPDALTSDGWVTDPVQTSDGTVYALSHSLTSPPEVHRIGDSASPVTSFTAEACRDLQMGEVREIHFEGADGDPVQMFLVDPPGADPSEALPLVHMIHGGPHGSFGDAWHWRWNSQVVAASGYRVALVNFHGSTGWGDSFARSIHGAWGDLPYRDIEAATDHLVAAGLADPERMAVTGGSYGGYLVAWITSQTDRYACAVAHAAVTDLPAMYASDIVRSLERAFGSVPWDDIDTVNRFSPIAHAKGFSTPTLVIHGDRDARVPVDQGLELYGILAAKGVPARLVSYPDENHWVLRRSNSIRWYAEVLGWLERWL